MTCLPPPSGRTAFTRSYPIAPHEFEFVWRLALEGPLAASEIADDLNRPTTALIHWTGSRIASQLRSLIKLGIVTSDGGSPAIYRLTDAGRAWIYGEVQR